MRAVEDEGAVIVVTDKSPSKVLRKFTDTYEENKLYGINVGRRFQALILLLILISRLLAIVTYGQKVILHSNIILSHMCC